MTEETVKAEEPTIVDDEEVTASSPVDEPKEVETPADAAEVKETDEPDKPDDKPKDQEKRNKVSAKDRINELTKEKYEQKRRADELESRLLELERRTQPTEPVRPKAEDFDTTAEYDAAVDQYYAKKSEYDHSKRVAQETQFERQKREQQERLKTATTFLQKVKEQEKLFDDFHGKVNDPVFVTIANQYTPEIVTIIQESEPALTYHLATHLNDAERIAALPPVQAARELAKLESRLENPKPKTVSDAPDPIQGAKSKSTIEKNPSDMNQKEFEEWRKKIIAQRR